MKRYVLSPITLAVTLLSACATEPIAPDEALGQRSDSLTEAQCHYFASEGSVQICHHTGRPRRPYDILRVRERACVRVHTEHPEDYVAINDPTCGGLGCLPDGAPCDDTVGCCDGLSCQNGTCVCTPTTCAAAGASCGTIPDGCGGTLDCGPCVTCPCAEHEFWETSPVDLCYRSEGGGFLGLAINGENNVSGGAYGVSDDNGEPGELFCMVQYPSGRATEYVPISQPEYELCKAQVQAVLDANPQVACERWPKCYPITSCENGEGGFLCGVIDDGCGGSLDCGPCVDCPCSQQEGWASTSLEGCTRSEDAQVAIGFLHPSGGTYGVSRSLGGELSCFTQPTQGSDRLEQSLSADQHFVCRREVESALAQAQQTCRPYSYETGCVPYSCGELGAACGAPPDGCGALLDCGSCSELDPN